jgi:hypothetical protein
MRTLLAFLMLTLTTHFHVGELAEYYISQEGSSIQMKVVLEKGDILSLDFKPDCDVLKTTALCVSKHISVNLTVEVNNKLLLFELGDSYTENDHLILFFTGELLDEKVKSVNIKNNCFYKFHNDYRNRIILDVDRFLGSYMLTAENNYIYLK